jgi:hypothetical protein
VRSLPLLIGPQIQVIPSRGQSVKQKGNTQKTRAPKDR